MHLKSESLDQPSEWNHAYDSFYRNLQITGVSSDASLEGVEVNISRNLRNWHLPAFYWRGMSQDVDRLLVASAEAFYTQRQLLL